MPVDFSVALPDIHISGLTDNLLYLFEKINFDLELINWLNGIVIFEDKLKLYSYYYGVFCYSKNILICTEPKRQY